MNAYWRSLASQAWAHASGAAGGPPGPVHLNLPLAEPLVPASPAAGEVWPEPLDGRPGGRPWTAFPAPATDPAGVLELGWAERGVVVCGDGDYDAGPLLALAAAAGWPVLAEPSSGARRGPNALRAYPYLLASPEFRAAHRPEVIVSAGRPGLSRGQLAFLRGVPGWPRRHVVIARGPGRWADPARTATDVASAVRLAGRSRSSEWLGAWQRADQAATAAADKVLDATGELSEPRLARDLAAALPGGALLWAASSLPVRDLDQHMAPRDGLRVLASRGASGIDGLVSAACGAALAHAAAVQGDGEGGGGPAWALLGDLAFLHDSSGLVLGPEEPRPDLCLVVVNNDGGGIFSGLEQAAFAGPFERVFGTPHGAVIEAQAQAAGLPYQRIGSAAQLAALARPGTGLRVAELRTSRAEQTALRQRIQSAAAAALARACG
jgi:2-succinyl-5-enolpyruvyl-6-hydroxy-3-cyclohexene-1-carboxylate synthase